ncbi:MAG: protein kinase [Polyangiaceae bacterium]
MVSSAKDRNAPPVAPGDVVAGKYKVLRVIGSGGMGIVVAATHVQLGQNVALKFLHQHVLDGELGEERFAREARAAVRLRSEHVARVYDVGVHDTGAPFSVMELLEGSDASTYAKDHDPLPIAQAVEIVVQSCDAVVEAHAAGIIHRDLKPQNLFVTQRPNGAMLVKVLDFGVSKWFGPAHEDMSLTDSSVIVGSPLYMAPEQMRAARNADTRSDIWALGVVLYELISGRVPFDGATVTELCLKVVHDPPAPIIELRPEIPDDLAAIIMRCLEKDPNARFPNVAMLAEALEPFAGNRATGRGWKSMVETGDSIDRDELPPSDRPSEGQTDSTRETSLASGSRPLVEPPPSSRGPKRRIFATGLVSGASLTALGAISVIAIWAITRSAPTDPLPVTAPSISAVQLPVPPVPTVAERPTVPQDPAQDPAPKPSATPSASAASVPSRPTPAVSAKKAAPVPAASASASARPITLPNGAPILH